MAWDTILIESPFGFKLDKEGVYRYYADPKIHAELLNELNGHPAIVVYRYGTRDILKRHPKPGEKKLIEIKKFLENPNDPSDLVFHTARRAVEFHKVMKPRTDEVVVDIDPGDEVPLNYLKAVVKEVYKVIKNFPGVTDVEIRYSGGRGFYVIGKLNKPMGIDRLRRLLKEDLETNIDLEDVVVGRKPAPHQVNLDLAPMKRGGSYRAIYSLNLSTGLASVRVPLSKLDKFDPKKDANPLRISSFPNIIKVKP